MREYILASAALLALSGCGSGSLPNLGVSPAPLQKVVIDDQAVRFGFLTVDTLATLADKAMDAGQIVPKSPAAMTIANGLEMAKFWLNAASYAQKSGSTESYKLAYENAVKAMGEVQLAIVSK